MSSIYLLDIKVEQSSKTTSLAFISFSLLQGFTLEFYFDSNEYFTNTVLTKNYVMRSSPDETDPFSFEGPEIIKCTG